MSFFNRYAAIVLAGVCSVLGVVSNVPADDLSKSKIVVFIAGGQSHDFGSHEHYAGCRILADAIERTNSIVRCKILWNGWPEDASILDDANSIVLYSDGGERHPFLPKLAVIQKQIDRGVGLVCIHYAVEVPEKQAGKQFLNWLGGYFETNWSVNPVWDAKFTSLPSHPITSGVKPFEVFDEWYFHMRFPESMEGITPILTAVPPEHTMSRPDGIRSGNPVVRKHVAQGVSQHVAWAIERPDGGRGFSYTGGHFHWNWGRVEPTRLVANAILWTAHETVPPTGAQVQPLRVERLKENQDEAVPTDFDTQKTANEFRLLSESNANVNLPPLAQSAAGLELAAELNATLAASTPMIGSLTNIDIDHRGRVWACEVVNYRKHKDDREQGDRILILEDTDQDGIMDKSKVFYQGRDIDSAMGICVLGNRVLVSASPFVLEFIDENGDDIPDSKKAVLTNTGKPQHDHSVHAVVFGPDGKLYFNFGNTGKQLCDANGKPIQDRWEREINDAGKPYRQGMVFRCNEDFSDVEVLGHNFRNNYEVAVDSFGTLWQSDNDDDGNNATRINYVMEFGNFGYVDEMSGAAWKKDRPNLELDIPSRHWHLNDPGVVPNLLMTGSSSPTGITIYEGTLLPERFRGQILHCDAGPNAVRSYHAQKAGAGYSASINNVVIGKADQWFRPSDVCVAPDGSLFVADWYDPGVGGHEMADTNHGRLFRIAPHDCKYVTPSLDLNTPEGAATALQSPCNSIRYLAFQSLKRMDKAAIAAITKLADNRDPRLRSRAYWVWCKIGDPLSVVRRALADTSPDVRITGIRIARQFKLTTQEFVVPMLTDSSPEVRRELAIALREDRSEQMPSYWSQLAGHYDGQDRWYLEALGIAATDRWEECLRVLQNSRAKMTTGAWNHLIWRSRGGTAALLQTELLQSGAMPPQEVPAMFRAIEMQSERDYQSTLNTLCDWARSVPIDASPVYDATLVELAMRSERLPSDSKPIREAALRHLTKLKNPQEQVRLIRKLALSGQSERLIDVAAIADSSLSLEALETAIHLGDIAALKRTVENSAMDTRGLRVSNVLSLSDYPSVHELRKQLFESPTTLKQVKIDAVVGLARSPIQHNYLLESRRKKALPEEAALLIGGGLRSSESEQVRIAASELFPVVRTATQPLPSIEHLSKQVGDANIGSRIYFGIATCFKCHQVGAEGKNVGPALSEIGTKLSRESMYAAIIAPSAGISHNYESYVVRTADDEILTGLLVSDTPDSITLKDVNGTERVFERRELQEIKKSEKSLMPENLHELMTDEDLINLVEYLMSLRKQ